MRKIVIIVVLAVCIFLPKESGARSFVTIGTGGVTGVYYPLGGAISKMFNKYHDHRPFYHPAYEEDRLSIP